MIEDPTTRLPDHITAKKGVKTIEESQAFLWHDFLTILTPIVLLAGAVTYGVQRIGYERFYSPLGVDPADVGVSYASTLARSAVFIFVTVTSGLIGSSVVLFFTRSNRKAFRIALLGPIGFLVLSTFLTALVIPAHGAEAVQEGRAVGPYTWFGLPEIPMRADPVTIGRIGRMEEASVIDSLTSRSDLLYLGQANGTVVLYDPSSQRSILLPSTATVLTISNCAAKRNQDTRCRHRYHPQA